MDFDGAAAKVKCLKQRPSDAELLELYGLYKQATAGDNTSSKPWIVDMKGRAKWDAWEVRKGLSIDEAKQLYIKLVQQLIDKYSLE